MEEVPGAVPIGAHERPGEQNGTQGRATATNAEERLVLAGESAPNQPLAKGRAHRATSAVEPVALAVGGMPLSAPADSGPAGV